MVSWFSLLKFNKLGTEKGELFKFMISCNQRLLQVST